MRGRFLGASRNPARRVIAASGPASSTLEARTVPAISINDVPVLEGDAGTVNAVFDVSLDQVEAVDVTVDFTTQDGTAMTADGDYVLNTGQVVIPAGMLSAPITIVVNGDTTLETDETFSVILSNPMGTTITDDTGIGTITNDENTPPTLANVMATPTMVNENGLATLTGDIVDPDGADTFTLTVDWGDGSALEMFTYPAGTTTFSETHQYVDDAPSGTASDERTIDLTLSDDQGGSDTALTTATVQNIAPILGTVMVTSPLNEGLVANLTGSFADPGTLDTFTLTVNWGDGAPVEMFNLPAGATTFSQMHQYRDDGMFPISVTLADDDLGTDMDMTTITVNNVAPTLSIVSVTSPINENGVATLTGAMTDPGTQDAFTLTVNWGDGSAPEMFLFPAGTTTFNQTHLYRDDAPTGTVSDDITINLTLADGDGGSDAETATVRVNNIAPTMGDIALTPINENGTTTLTGTITDPGTLDTFSLVINWGDGTAAQIVNLGAGSTSFSVTHQYRDDGTFSIDVSIVDDDLGSDAATTSLMVNNVAPTVTLAGSEAGVRGQDLTFTLTATDPSSVDQAGTFTYVITWGDGMSDTVTGPATHTVTHTFAAAGDFTISVTARDKDMATGAADTLAVSIAAVALEVDPSNPEEMILVVGGTVGDSWIDLFRPSADQEMLIIRVDGETIGTFNIDGFGRIVIACQEGNDRVEIGPDVRQDALIESGAGDDTLIGGSGNDRLVGGNGNDLVMATGTGNFTLADTMLTGAGMDGLDSIERASLVALAGDNVFDVSGFTGLATLDGAGGTDQFLLTNSITNASFELTGPLVRRLVAGEARGDFLLQAIEGFMLGGGNGGNTLTINCTGPSNCPPGGFGGIEEVVFNGKQAILTDRQLVVTEAGGTTTITFDTAVEAFTLSGTDLNDFLDASGYPRSVILDGGPGKDKLLGGPGNEPLSGGPGNDTLRGGDGIDRLVETGEGRMTLSNAQLTAILGRDSVKKIEEASLTGGIGNDRLNAAGFTRGPVTLDGGIGNDKLTGTKLNDSLIGGEGVDNLAGGLGNDTLDGGAGNDKLNGAAGDDRLLGGDGDDNLLASAGNDFLDGGAGLLDTANGGAGTDMCLNAEKTKGCEL